jgi:hypothetical protein
MMEHSDIVEYLLYLDKNVEFLSEQNIGSDQMTDKPTQLFIELAYFILYFNQA